MKGEIYHVFNRSIARLPIFHDARDYQRLLDIIRYCRFSPTPLRFSHYNRLMKEQKEQVMAKLIEKDSKKIEVYAYCFMPNHFHFLLKKNEDLGVTTFLGNIQNSYAKYFNLKYDRTGSLFQSRFKAVRVETDEQLLHVMRYIHLNPSTSFLIKNKYELENYAWASFHEYVTNEPSIVTKEFIMRFFASLEEYKQFHYDQVNYQRTLSLIKHLTF